MTLPLPGQQALRSEHWQQRNAHFDSLQNSTTKKGFVFLGNSITEGFELNHYFMGRPVINRGISGDHLDGLLARLGNSVFSLEPEKLFIMIGINDIGDGKDNEYIGNLYQQLIDSIQAGTPQTEIYIHSVLPTSARWNNCPPQQIKNINQFLKRLAGPTECTFIDLYPHYIKGDTFLNPALSDDGLHLNREGYKIWADLLEQKYFDK